MNIVCFIAGLFIGSNVGLFAFALMSAAARENRERGEK